MTKCQENSDRWHSERDALVHKQKQPPSKLHLQNCDQCNSIGTPWQRRIVVIAFTVSDVPSVNVMFTIFCNFLRIFDFFLENQWNDHFYFLRTYIAAVRAKTVLKIKTLVLGRWLGLQHCNRLLRHYFSRCQGDQMSLWKIRPKYTQQPIPFFV
jgi:hypothetical protein